MVKAKLGKMDEALRHQLRAVEIQPKNPDYFMFLGLLYEVNGNRAGATQAYRNMQQLDPASPVPQDALRRLAEMK
jgi:Flp pilus assembly protein TadD